MAIPEELHADLARLECGDYAAFARLRARDAPANPALARARELMLQATAWFFDAGTQSPPTPEVVSACARDDADARTLATLACVPMERAAVLAWDTGGLARWLDVHARLLGEAAATDPTLRTFRLWHDLLRGETATLEAAVKSLRVDATRAQAPGPVIEATALGALIALGAGEIDNAVAQARRASRMARTEGLPYYEHIANVVLARVRRHAGRPHLAMRILAALARFATWRFRGWLTYELLLAGGDDTARSLCAQLESGATPGLTDRARAAATALADLLTATHAGERTGFDRHATALGTATADLPRLVAETDDVLALLDLRRPASATVQPWRAGKVPMPPTGLHGLCAGAPLSPAGDASIGYVIAQPGSAGQRVLRVGLPLLETPGRRLDVLGEGGQARAVTGIATLALVGPDGLDKEDFFRAVYLFSFVPELHKGVLDVLVHRMRKLAAGFGEIQREGEHISLRLDAPALIPDPRGAQPAEERVIRYLATSGPVTTQMVADHLQLPLRTVQALFHQLVDEGAARPMREGRNVRYQIEDTTFSEPTPLVALPFAPPPASE